MILNVPTPSSSQTNPSMTPSIRTQVVRELKPRLTRREKEFSIELSFVCCSQSVVVTAQAATCWCLRREQVCPLIQAHTL